MTLYMRAMAAVFSLVYRSSSHSSLYSACSSPGLVQREARHIMVLPTAQNMRNTSATSLVRRRARSSKNVRRLNSFLEMTPVRNFARVWAARSSWGYNCHRKKKFSCVRSSVMMR